MKKPLLFTIIVYLFSAHLLWAQSWAKLRVGFGFQNISAICTDLSGNVYVSNGPTVLMRSGGLWVPLPAIPTSIYGSGSVTKMCTDATGNVFAACNFLDDSAKRFIAKWNGSSWSHLGPVTGSLDLINGLVCADPTGNIYSVGQATGDTLYNVFKFDGTVWTKLGVGSGALNTKFGLNAICSDPSGNIYIGGTMSKTIGGILYPYIAKWNGTAWSDLPAGNIAINPFNITSMITDTLGNVYATHILKDTNTYWSVCKWDGATWTILGTGADALKPNGPVRSLCRDSHGNIYAAGQFTDTAYTGTFDNAYVAKWDGVHWSELGTGAGRLHPHHEIWAISSDIHDNIYAIGAITDDEGYGFVGKYGPPPAAIGMPPAINNITIFPNPAHRQLKIALNSIVTNKEEKYYLLNMVGRIVASGVLETTISNIDISQLPSGVYLLQIGDNPNNITKVVVQ